MIRYIIYIYCTLLTSSPQKEQYSTKLKQELLNSFVYVFQSIYNVNNYTLIFINVINMHTGIFNSTVLNGILKYCNITSRHISYLSIDMVLYNRAATSSNFITRVLFNQYSTLERVLFFTMKSIKCIILLYNLIHDIIFDKNIVENSKF